jgi:outer membrane receptor for ferrienterochelin and colicin
MLTQEIGFRGKSEENRLHYDVTFYNSTLLDIVVSRTLTVAEVASNTYGTGYTTTSNINENAAELTARGMETQFAWNATQQIELASTYTWAQAYYNNYISTSCPKTGACTTTNNSGNSYQSMPTNHVNLRVAYKPIPGLRISLDGDYISAFYIDTANSGTYQRPAIFNLRSSYMLDKNWTATLHILNLGNVHYGDHVGDSTNGNPSTITYNSLGNSGSYEPLTLRVGATYKF